MFITSFISLPFPSFFLPVHLPWFSCPHSSFFDFLFLGSSFLDFFLSWFLLLFTFSHSLFLWFPFLNSPFFNFLLLIPLLSFSSLLSFHKLCSCRACMLTNLCINPGNPGNTLNRTNPFPSKHNASTWLASRLVSALVSCAWGPEFDPGACKPKSGGPLGKVCYSGDPDVDVLSDITRCKCFPCVLVTQEFRCIADKTGGSPVAPAC